MARRAFVELGVGEEQAALWVRRYQAQEEQGLMDLQRRTNRGEAADGGGFAQQRDGNARRLRQRRDGAMPA